MRWEATLHRVDGEERVLLSAISDTNRDRAAEDAAKLILRYTETGWTAEVVPPNIVRLKREGETLELVVEEKESWR